MKPSLTEAQLTEACQVWQKRLRLLDWDIDIEICRYHELNSQGSCTVTQELKYAKILIRDGIDAPNNDKATYDMEATLVHELLHIHFDAVANDYSSSIRLNPGSDSDGVNYKTIALEQAFCGLVPWMVEVGRVLPQKD